VKRVFRYAYEIGAVAMGPASVALIDLYWDGDSLGPFLLFPLVIVPGALVVPVLGRAYIRPYLWTAGVIGVSLAVFIVATYNHPVNWLWRSLHFAGWLGLACAPLSLPLVLLGLREALTLVWRRVRASRKRS